MTACDPRVGDQRRRPRPGTSTVPNSPRARRRARRPPRAQGAAGHVGGVLEDGAVAGRSDRRRGPHDLPERVVPGHDRQHHAERRERRRSSRRRRLSTASGARKAAPARRSSRSPGALLDFGFGLDDRLAHLAADDVGELVGGGAELARRPRFITCQRCSQPSLFLATGRSRRGRRPGRSRSAPGKKTLRRLEQLPVRRVDRLDHSAVPPPGPIRSSFSSWLALRSAHCSPRPAAIAALASLEPRSGT